MTNSRAAFAAAEARTPQVRNVLHILKPLKYIFIQGEADEMQGEDERREDNTGEEETTFTSSTQVS